jgi:spore coat polysaccharide biosynthesis protein SpsF
MLHRVSHLWEWSGAAWARLREHKAAGRLRALGVSVQNPIELERTLGNSEVEFIQMPYNLLDSRWDDLIPMIRATKQQRPLMIHARSALLQGLLPSTTLEYWHKANVEDPEPIMEWLRSQCSDAGMNRVADFCLRFVKSLDWVDGVVVGMETFNQLSENIRIFCGSDLPAEKVFNIQASRPALEENTLNPALWRQCA